MEMQDIVVTIATISYLRLSRRWRPRIAGGLGGADAVAGGGSADGVEPGRLHGCHDEAHVKP